MRKAALFTAAAILIASGVAAAMKWSEPPTDAPALHAAVVTGPSAATPAPMMKIVPAPVIDPHAEVFVGTGDGSGGAWVKP